MWFKNLAVYRFGEPFALNAAELDAKLQAGAFRPCAAQEESSAGWTPPGKGMAEFVLSANGCFLFCFKKQEKVVPAAVINELLAERVEELESRESRKLPAKERNRMKDELLFELLPRAFSYSRKVYAYIDPRAGFLAIDAATPKKAEHVLQLLRNCLGNLPVSPMSARAQAAAVMTEWLARGNPPSDMVIEDECELRSHDEEAGIVRCRRHDLQAPEIKNHLDSGKAASKLALTWQERLSFVLDEHMWIKRLRFLDLIQEQAAEIETFDELGRLDADFSIMSAELAQFILRLWVLFETEVST